MTIEAFAVSILGLDLGLVILLTLSGRVKPAPGNFEAKKLRPCEMAYLHGRGDMTKTMVVLVFDMLHRVLKGADVDEAPYEKEISARIAELLKDYAHGQITKRVKVPSIYQPVALSRFVISCYRFLTETLRRFITQTLHDPRHLKKYFSPGLVLSLVADFLAMGVARVVEPELKKELLKQGLIESESKSADKAKKLDILSGFVLLFTLGAMLVFLPQIDKAPLLLTLALAFLNAFFLRFLWYLRSFIPVYDQVKDLIKHVKRQSRRLEIVRFAISLVTVTVQAIVMSSALFMLLMEGLVFALFFAKAALALVGVTIVLTVNFLLLAEIQAAKERLSLGLNPSSEAIFLLNQERERLAHESPLQAFGEMLTSPNYDPLFADILALYGIESLVLLA